MIIPVPAPLTKHNREERSCPIVTMYGLSYKLLSSLHANDLTFFQMLQDTRIPSCISLFVLALPFELDVEQLLLEEEGGGREGRREGEKERKRNTQTSLNCNKQITLSYSM